MFPRTSTFLTLAFCGGCFFLPEQYFPGPLKPVNHMLNVVVAGINMGLIYKFSNNDITVKNAEASEQLKKGLQKNGGIYIKLGQLIATLDVIVPE